MRRKLAYFGLSLFLIGIICLIVGGVNLRNVTLTEVNTSSETWEVVGSLVGGRTYQLYIESGDAWGEPFAHGDFEDAQPINVTVYSPNGGLTKLQAFFYGLPTTSPYYREGTPPAMVDVVYQLVDNSSLQVDAPSSRIRFTAKKDGNYTVRVLEEGLWVKAPPNYMIFYEEVVLGKDLYTLLVLFGGLLSIGGGVISIWSALGKKHVKRRKAHK